MTTQTSNTDLIEKATAQPTLLQRILLFTMFLACGLAIFLFGAYYYDVIPTNKNLTYSSIISAVFLAISLWLKYDKRWNKYWRIAFAFFIASIANPFTALFSGWIWMNVVMKWFPVAADTSQGLAIDKICEMLLKVVPIMLLVKISGKDFGSVYIKRGNIRLGVGIGLLVFFFLAPASFMFASQRFTSVDTLVAAVIWGLVFSIANAFMEELWIRGIFLKNLAPVIGNNGSVWLTAIVFALMHGFAFYFIPQALPFFVANTLALGLACGFLMVKSDSIWGPVIIHAASDFFLFLAVLANA